MITKERSLDEQIKKVISKLNITKTIIEEMVQEAVKNGKSERRISAFTGQEVDHETEPPNGYDYHWWERRSRDYYREDLVKLKFIDGKFKLYTKHIRNYDTGWRF